MKDFWLSCGHHLLDRDAGGALLVTDELLKAYLARPELAPPANACIAERTLHAALLTNPRRSVDTREIAAIADPDARENWSVMLVFRDRLIRHSTVEAAYLDLIRHGVGDTPPLFLSHLVQLILRNLLDRCEDPFVLRAAELFFRPQRLGVHAGALIAADEETIAGAVAGPLSPLVAMLGLPATGEIDVLNEENASTYWMRSDRFDMALDLTAGRRGLAALGEVIERWIAHLLVVAVRVEPLIEAADVNLVWYVGLDAEATLIGDALWNGEELDPTARERIIGLYRLTLVHVPQKWEPVLRKRTCTKKELERDDDKSHPALADRAFGEAGGEPIYLILAMTPERTLRMKPQNLLTGLPIARLEAVS